MHKDLSVDEVHVTLSPVSRLSLTVISDYVITRLDSAHFWTFENVPQQSETQSEETKTATCISDSLELEQLLGQLCTNVIDP